MAHMLLTAVYRTGQDYIMLGGKEINYNNNFRLYLTTNKPNPHFLPDICIKVTIINFTITFEGLQVSDDYVLVT